MEISTCMRSAVDSISPLVDHLMTLIKGCCLCDLEQEEDLEMALREALANAVLHGNQEDAGKRVYVRCRLELCGELSIIVKDEGTGFDPNNLANPIDIANLTSTHGRGIYLMRALMDDVRFEQGGTEVHMRKTLSHRNGNHRSGYR
jgi:serine/threonine-protein kinase RsbW